MNFFPKPSPAQVRGSLTSRMRLFLSADIVGSTAYKQRQPESDRWFRVVMRFYRDAESHFLARWRARAATEVGGAERGLLFGERPPELWKTIGDEVVFTQVVQRPWQVAMCVSIWLEALVMIRADLQKADSSLDVKSTGWLADFPLRNREVGLQIVPDPLEEPEDIALANQQRLNAYCSGKPGFVRDFIGPAIDTGFRLGSLASPRRFAISLELAHILSGVHGEMDSTRPVSALQTKYAPPFIYYAGAEPLKGVLGGVPYPNFWIDVGGERLYLAEDRLLGREPADLDATHRFTSAFLEKYPDQFCAGLSWWAPQPPPAYQAYCDMLSQQLVEEERRLSREEQQERLRSKAGAVLDDAATSRAEIDWEIDLGP
jgi:hypothetical protein